MTFFKTVLSIKLFYIFVFLFLIYQIISYNLNTNLSKKVSISELIEKLETYRIKNIYYSFFILILYISFYLLLFLYFRISNLGSKMEVFVIYQISLNSITLLTIFFYFMSVSYYIMILNTLCYTQVIKLHFYFFPNKIYEKILDVERLSPHIDTLLSNLMGFFYDKTVSKDLFIKLQPYDIITNEPIISSLNNKIWHLVNYYKILFWLFKILTWILHKVSNGIVRFIYYLPYTILLILLVYEICEGVIFYTYYILLYIFILNIVRKVRYFLHVKDPLYDNQIHEYLYLDIISYEKIQHYLAQINGSTIINIEKLREKLEGIIRFQEEIVDYIKHDYKVYYIIDPNRANNEKYLNNYYKRIHLIILMFLSIIYIHNVNKYSLIIVNNNINILLIMIPLFITIILTFHRVLCEVKNPTKNNFWTENNVFKFVFRILVIVFTIPILYIILKNKFTMIPNEIIFEIRDYVIIKESFSVEDKIRYVKQYMNYLQLITQITKEQLEYVIIEITESITNNKEILLEEIRTKIELLINSWKPETDIITWKFTIITIINKIKEWIQ